MALYHKIKWDVKNGFALVLQFLGTDSNPMTHETWQSGQAIVVRVDIRLKTFIEKIAILAGDISCPTIGGTYGTYSKYERNAHIP